MLEEKNKILDLKKILTIILSKWYIIVACLTIAVSITYIKLRYTIPQYTAALKLKYDDERGSQLSDVLRYGRATGRIESQMRTESEIIRSRSIAIKTLQELQYNFSYTIEGKILTTRLYPNNLFTIIPLYIDSNTYGKSFTLNFIGGDKFEYTYKNKKSGLHRFGDTIVVEHSMLSVDILDQKSLNEYINVPIIATVNDVFSAGAGFAGTVNIDDQKGTTILNLSYTSDVPQFAVDYLNALSRVYIREQVNIKSQAAEQTLNFISNQLDQLSSNVDKAQQQLSDFKSQNKGVSPEDIGHSEYQKLVQLEVDKNIELIKQNLLNKMIKEVQLAANKPVELLTLDIDDAKSVESFQNVLNSLIMDRLSLSQRYNSESSVMIENEKKIKNIKEAFLKALYSNKSKLDDKISYLNKMIDDTNLQLRSLPSKQQILVNLQRNYNVNEKIFSYLLEKRLETMLTRASIIPSTSIIDEAQFASKVYPNENKNYIFSISIALLLSMFIIALIRVLNDKIPDKETIEMISKIPVLGVIKKLNNADNDYEIHAFKNPKSVFSESIRGIRTGISFIAKGQEKKVICVTSTVSGEGKTFCSINLAASITLLNKKVVLIGCDLRRPKVHLSFNNITNSIGLTTYLIGKSSLDQIIQKTTYDNLDVITAGPTPPNPSELLQTEEMSDLLKTLREKYDYIIIDSAPVGLVSDSLTIMEMADINLYVIRAQYSKRDFAQIPDRLKGDSDIKNLYTVLNAYDNTSVIYSSIYKNDYGGYYSGGGYYYYGGYYGKGGYGYYGNRYNDSYYSGYYSDDDDNTDENKSWFGRLFKRNKKS
jgi:tyrosine-protein kinase Etk/Wzc